MIKIWLTVAMLNGALIAAENNGKAALDAPTKAKPNVAFAIANDEAVVIHFDDGTTKTMQDTANARGIAMAPGNTEIYVAGPHALRRINIETGDSYLLTDGWEMIDGPAPSPDGRIVAFAGYTKDAKWSVYTIAGRNGNPSYIAHGTLPAWDTDGSGLLFENYTDESAQIYRYDPKTRDVSKIKYDNDGDIRNAVSATVSPDGWQMSFAWNSGLYVRNRGDYTTRRVTDGEHYDSRQRFTPDGRQLYFIRKTIDQHGRRIDPRAMKLDLVTGAVKPLVDASANSVAAPAGNYLIYQCAQGMVGPAVPPIEYEDGC